MGHTTAASSAARREHAPLLCNRPPRLAWRPTRTVVSIPLTARLVPCFFALLPCTRCVASSEPPAACPVRRGSSLRPTCGGTPCTTGDDCGGYAVFVPLWCRRGEAADTPTCRAYVGKGDPCGTTDVLGDASVAFGSKALLCVGRYLLDACHGRGTRRRVPDGPRPVAVYARSRLPVCGKRRPQRAVRVGGCRRGRAWGSPGGVCAAGTECVNSETGSACPLTQAVGTPPLAVDESYRFPAGAGTDTTAAVGTCRPAAAPTVGTPCDDRGAGDTDLVCSRVASTGPDGRLPCVRRTAPGAPLRAVGCGGRGCVQRADGRRGRPAVHFNGTCVRSVLSVPLVATVGHECTFGDGPAGGDGVDCVFFY